MQRQSIVCACGCGNLVPIRARQQPRFIHGHNRRGQVQFKNTRPVLDRFWDKVEKTDGCWIWNGARHPLGYGNFRPGQSDRQYVSAHVFAYELMRGPVPRGLVLDHLCRNPPCVNPAHLEPVTQRENILRGASPRAQAHNRGTCEQGHSGAALYWRKDGRGFNCRECRRARRASQHS